MPGEKGGQIRPNPCFHRLSSPLETDDQTITTTTATANPDVPLEGGVPGGESQPDNLRSAGQPGTGPDYRGCDRCWRPRNSQCQDPQGRKHGVCFRKGQRDLWGCVCSETHLPNTSAFWCGKESGPGCVWRSSRTPRRRDSRETHACFHVCRTFTHWGHVREQEWWVFAVARDFRLWAPLS